MDKEHGNLVFGIWYFGILVFWYYYHKHVKDKEPFEVKSKIAYSFEEETKKQTNSFEEKNNTANSFEEKSNKAN